MDEFENDLVNNDDFNEKAENFEKTNEEGEQAKYYTYESNEFAGSNAMSEPVKRGFFRKVTATVGFAATFGIIAGACIHFTNQFFEDKNEQTEVTIGGNNTTVTGASAIGTTTVLNSDVEVLSDVSDVAQAVMPSVVAVTETSVESVGGWYGMTEQEVQGSGSGIIIKEDKENLFIVTNNHVIDGAKTIEVTFVDDTTAKAELKGSVESEDIAVIVIKKADLSDETLGNIKIATLGDSDNVKVGQAAIAIGNALGRGQSVTSGVISAVDREISVSASDNTITISVLQTDAAINPGNSGGALLDASGKVIGINSAKLASSEVEGMGYAIPITNVMNIITDIINKEVVPEGEQGYLGIIGGTVTSTLQNNYGLPKGVYVSSVADDGPAKEAGLLAGDIIVGINNITISSMDDLSSQIKSFKAGSKVSIKYKRLEKGEYKENTIEVTLITMPEDIADESDNKADDKSNNNYDDKSGKNDGSQKPNNGYSGDGQYQIPFDDDLFNYFPYGFQYGE